MYVTYGRETDIIESPTLMSSFSVCSRDGSLLNKLRSLIMCVHVHLCLRFFYIFIILFHSSLPNKVSFRSLPEVLLRCKQTLDYCTVGMLFSPQLSRSVSLVISVSGTLTLLEKQYKFRTFLVFRNIYILYSGSSSVLVIVDFGTSGIFQSLNKM